MEFKLIHSIVEYYWREYNGIIPNDAIPGGFDSAGNPTYIGQIPYRGPRLLPATIHKDCSTAYSTVYGREVTADTHVKVRHLKLIKKFNRKP